MTAASRGRIPGPVLVIGAAGKTGRAVAMALGRRGVPVRAGVRPGREGAAPAGTSPVAVDLETGGGLEDALTGVAAAYHLAPNVHPDEVGMARRVADAGRAADLPHLVFHSVLHPHDPRMPHHLRKAEAEAVLHGALPGRVTVLRPAAYHQNLLEAALRGEMAVPYSLDAPFTTVDLDDVAQVAARVLLDPAAAGGVHDLAGPEVLTTRQMAEAAAALLGRPVAVRRLTTDEWLAGPGSRLRGAGREALLAMFAAYDEHGLVGDPGTLATLLGRRATTWAERVRAAAAAAAAADAPGAAG